MHVVRLGRQIRGGNSGGGMKKILALLALMCLAVAAGAQTNMALLACTSITIHLESTLSTVSSTEGDAFSGLFLDSLRPY